MAILFKNKFAVIDESMESISAVPRAYAQTNVSIHANECEHAKKKQSSQSRGGNAKSMPGAASLISIEYQPWNIPRDVLIKRIQEGKQEFPIDVGTHGDVMERFANLVRYKPRMTKNFVLNSLACIFIDSTDYNKINNICDYYTGRTRAEYARRPDEPSPAEYFRKNGQDIVKTLLAKDRPEGNIEAAVAKLIYEKHIGVPNFKCTVFAALLKFLGAKNVIDAATSWGDRLVASIAKGVTYEGYEPDERFQVGYGQMIDDFCKLGCGKKYKVHSSLDNFRNGPKDADLAVMIPDCNIASRDQWVANVQNLTKIMCDRLVPGGHLVLCVFDTRQIACQRIQEYLTGPCGPSAATSSPGVNSKESAQIGLGLRYQGVIRTSKGNEVHHIERGGLHVYKK